MKSNTAMRASTWVLKRRRSSNSHSSVAKKLSHIALSKQSPTEPIEGRTPGCWQRPPKASEVYLLPWEPVRSACLARLSDTGFNPVAQNILFEFDENGEHVGQGEDQGGVSLVGERWS